uniref:Uncharacterized protein n=1 Tax=Vibrio phage Vc1 TaxID=1480731 RepID=A0A6M5CDQ0_9CAUD
MEQYDLEALLRDFDSGEASGLNVVRPVAIFITRSAALAYAEKQYGAWRAKGIRVQVATEKDWECIK